MLPPSHVPLLDGPRLTAHSSREARGQCASHGHQPSCAVSPGPGPGGGVEPAGRQAAPGWALRGQVWPRRSGPGSLVPCPPPSPRLSLPPVPLMPRCDRPAQSALFNPGCGDSAAGQPPTQVSGGAAQAPGVQSRTGISPPSLPHAAQWALRPPRPPKHKQVGSK